jgi:hypothetical protein
VEQLAYLATFFSLILGLAVANVLTHLSSLVKRGRQADWYLLHTLWAMFVLLLLALEWRIILEWAAEPNLSFYIYLFLLTKPCVLFLLSDLLFPDRTLVGQVDLRQHFFEIRTRFFPMFILYGMLDVVDTLLKGVDHFRSLGPIYPAMIVLTTITSVIAARSSNERVHYSILAWSFLIIGISIINAFGGIR